MAIRQWIQRHRTEITLFLISFIVHLAASVFLYAKYHDPVPYHRVLYFENEDAIEYLDVAKQIVSGHGFSRHGVPAAVRTPVYPLLLAIPMLARLPITWSILIMQNIIASLAGVMLYRAGKLLFSERAGKIAGYIYALEPYMIMSANLATTETLFNFLLICFLYYFACYALFAPPQTRALIASGVFLGLAVLTRPVALYTPALVILIFGLLAILKKRSIRQAIIHCAFWIGVFLAILAPWSIREYVHYGTFRITNIDANMMYFRIAPLVVADQEGIGYVQAIEKLRQRLMARFPDFVGEKVYTTFDYYDFMTGETGRLVSERPFLVAKYYALSLIPALTGTGYEYMLENVVGLARAQARQSFTELLAHRNWAGYVRALSRMDIFQAALILGALVWVAVYLLIFWTLSAKVWWQKHGMAFAILLLFAAYFIFFSLGPQIHARYRMPTLPFLYLLLGYSIVQLKNGRTINR